MGRLRWATGLGGALLLLVLIVATAVWLAAPPAAPPGALPPSAHPAGDAPGATLGAEVYVARCATCHGPYGRGDGPQAASLQPRPRDFSRGIFKLKSTPGATPPTLADVRTTITGGIPGCAMPPFGGILTVAETDAVATYVRNFGPHREWGPSTPPFVDRAVLADASAARGRELYASMGCPACHGIAGRGDGAAAPALRDVWGQPDPPRDLTAPWTFRGGAAPDALATRIAYGMSGTPMPGFAAEFPPPQIADVVTYVVSLGRPHP